MYNKIKTTGILVVFTIQYIPEFQRTLIFLTFFLDGVLPNYHICGILPFDL
jgi:hypothetical protein